MKKANHLINKAINKRGEEDFVAGIISAIITTGIIVWIAGDIFGWGRTILWIVVFFAGLLGLAYLFGAFSDFSANAKQRKVEWQQREEEARRAAKLQAEQQKIEEENRQRREAQEIKNKERASYDAYKSALRNCYYCSDLKEATDIIDKLFNDNNENRRSRIIPFFDKYLPIITETLEASKHSDTDIHEVIEQFTKTVNAFYKNLYNAEDVVSVNKAILESLAIRDGLYNPYKDEIELSEDSE